MGLSQFITTTQFYLYGRSHFTATGWQKASKKYVEGELDGSLAGKYFAVSGANSGIGKECVRYLYSKGATVFMLCRNRERGEEAKKEISEKEKSQGTLEVVIGDLSLSSGVRQAVDVVKSKTSKLDALVCNAGALFDKKMLTEEGVETTFAAHFAFGSYLLQKELKPLLQASEAPRVIFNSSGGMYNAKFPGVDKCKDPPEEKYDGQFAYAYAKRGQVLLAEKLSQDKDNKVVYVSSHPGWTATPGVDKAYGSDKKWLEPMRTAWQGAEGICWLCVADQKKLEPGAFYLDRMPQRKHLAGPFFGEGSATKNTPEEVDKMVADLEALCASASSNK